MLSEFSVTVQQLVTLPYNLLLQPSARKALNIDLNDQIIIIDEAHSVYSVLHRDLANICD